MREWITGSNSVYETLQAKRRRVFRLLVNQATPEKGRLGEIVNLVAGRKLPIERVPIQRLDSLDLHHQNVALEVDSYPYSTLPEILERAKQASEKPLLLILDVLQDPQNMGTLLRTAEIVGVQGVLLPLRHTATITPAVVSSSSGACEHLMIAQVNLAQAISQLKKDSIWVVGLENKPQAYSPDQVDLDCPLALVVGSEGKGMRPLVAASCDFLLRIPMRGQINSLNAAVAGSIALYFAWQARHFMGGYSPGSSASH